MTKYYQDCAIYDVGSLYRICRLVY